MSDRKSSCPVCKVRSDHPTRRCPRCGCEVYTPKTYDRVLAGLRNSNGRRPPGQRRDDSTLRGRAAEIIRDDELSGESEAHAKILRRNLAARSRYAETYETWKRDLRRCEDFDAAFAVTDRFAVAVGAEGWHHRDWEIVPHRALLDQLRFLREYIRGPFRSQEKIVGALAQAGHLDKLGAEEACVIANRLLIEELWERKLLPWVLALRDGDFTVLADPKVYPKDE